MLQYLFIDLNKDLISVGDFCPSEFNKIYSEVNTDVFDVHL